MKPIGTLSKAARERICRNAGVPMVQGLAHLTGGKKPPRPNPLATLLRQIGGVK